jgi:HTH-type transcriptional regulator/antitoxin HigA
MIKLMWQRYKLKIMEAKLIKTDEEYNIALSRIDELFDVTPDSKEFNEAELLIALVELYEQKHYKIEAPDPIEAIKFRMEQMGMKKIEMTKFFGTRGRVSEILNRQRALTLAMIKKLHKEFGIPAESLIA